MHISDCYSDLERDFSAFELFPIAFFCFVLLVLLDIVPPKFDQNASIP